MALEHAILVSLQERIGSGYELERRFAKSIGFFWSASHQQIYRTLRRMEDAGWVTSKTVPQHGKPDRRVYEVAPAGREELARWLAAPTDVPTLRDELAVKIRGAGFLKDLSPLLDQVAAHRDEHAKRLSVYEQIAERDFSSTALTAAGLSDTGALIGQRLHQFLVLRGGIRIEQGFVEWCDEILDALSPQGHLPQ